MNEILIAAGYGILGALVRALITSLKVIQLRGNIRKGFWVYLITILAIGAFSGIILSYGNVLSFLAGYAGLDLMEGYRKSILKKKIRFS
ncbi:hypothetical protein HQ529_00330 [Candidatus Woesearchaeota archaeon]|nr:hypothetical protein [Candidatus Woesearchaeota archaeon]